MGWINMNNRIPNHDLKVDILVRYPFFPYSRIWRNCICINNTDGCYFHDSKTGKDVTLGNVSCWMPSEEIKPILTEETGHKLRWGGEDYLMNLGFTS